MPSVCPMKGTEGGSGRCGQWQESWVCKLEGLPPHVLTFPSNAFLGSPGGVDRSASCSDFCRKLPISKALTTFKNNTGGFSAGTGRCGGVEGQAGKCPGDQQVVLRPALPENPERGE